MNREVLLDKLSEFLMVEQCGWQLYRVVGERTTNPDLKERYEEFGRETDRHRTILTGLIRELGGDQDYVSPTARLAQAKLATLGLEAIMGQTTPPAADRLDECVIQPELKLKQVHPAPIDKRNLLDGAELPAAQPTPTSRTSSGA